MKKSLKILGTIAILMTLQACSSLTTKQKDYELVVVHVNDVHGRAVAGSNDGMGYANIATIIEDLKKDKANKEVMFLDAGDTFHGTTFATLEKGASIAKILEKMNLRAMTLGNHDFNYGANRISELDKNFKFDMIASNVKYKNGKEFTKPYIIENLDGMKVGIFGLSTPETLYKTNPKNVENLIIEDPIETSKKIVKELKDKGVNFIILLSHLGLDESTKVELRSDAVAKAVPEINLIIDGHSHTVLKEKSIVNGVAIVQTGEYSKNVGVIKIDADEISKGPYGIDYRLISKNEVVGKVNSAGIKEGGIEENKELKSYIDEIKKEQSKITDKIIGKTTVKLIGDRELVRTQETNLSDLIADAILWKSGADMSVTNGGGIRASIETGDITVGNVISVLPFGNYVVTKELTGKDIKDVLEHGFKDMPNSAGSLAQVGGISLTVDLNKSYGERVSNIKFKNGKKFDLNKKYVVATNDFMAIGGDKYETFKGKKEIANYAGLDEIVVEYINTKGIIPNKADGRVKVKK